MRCCIKGEIRSKKLTLGSTFLRRVVYLVAFDPRDVKARESFCVCASRLLVGCFESDWIALGDVMGIWLAMEMSEPEDDRWKTEKLRSGNRQTAKPRLEHECWLVRRLMLQIKLKLPDHA